jgi:hypothetical protein
MALAADRAPSKRILKEQKDKYWTLRGFGYSMTESSQLAGFSYASAARLEGTAKVNGDKIVEQRREQFLPNPKTFKELSKDAKKAFEDFEYFQLRYFGRVAIPWQKEAAEKVVDFLATPDREYVVINCPPGSGKTLTFTHDIPAWLTVRNRSIRGMMGSATQRLAERYANRLRRTLERTLPEVASTEDKDKGYATDAVSTLAKDFGRFKPMDRDLWTINQFVVMQPRGDATTEKEPTWTAYGADQSYIGGRYDFVIWDDLVDPRKLRTIEAKEDLQETFSDIAESRLEPGGLLVLQGQRISSDDLYRFCLDQEVPEMEDPDTGEMLSSRKKYHHIVFKAHYPEKCKPEYHTKNALAYPKGCLLSPWRLPWRDISQLMANRAQRFEVLYQQEDVDNESVLVKPDWVYGRSGYPGCVDKDRGILEIPKGLSGETFSVASVDPSPTRMWCLAEGTPILTDRGERRIESVRPGDRVLTRAGYKRVYDAAQTGYRQVLDIGLSNGATLRCTPEHLIATPGGWRPARELAPGSVLVAANRSTRPATSMSPVNPEVGTRVGMTEGTVRPFRLGLDVRGAGHVGSMVLDREMTGIDAQRPATQMADLRGIGDLSYESLIGPAMRQAAPHNAVGPTTRGLGGSRPYPTSPVLGAPGTEVSLIDGDFASSGFDAVPAGATAFALRTLDHRSAFTDVHVVSITTGSITNVYDLAVEECPEFVANGVLVHNSIQWWVYHPDSEQRFLIDLERRVMEAPEFIDWNQNNRVFTGIMEEWQQTSVALGHPITHWIVEINAAQRFMLQYEHVRRWQGLRNVTIIPHATHRNKSDPDYGVQTVGPHWEFGRVRLPWKDTHETRVKSLRLIDEVTRYPHGRTDDCLMAHWFVEWNLPNIYYPKRHSEPAKRPSWLKKKVA